MLKNYYMEASLIKASALLCLRVDCENRVLKPFVIAEPTTVVKSKFEDIEGFSILLHHEERTEKYSEHKFMLGIKRTQLMKLRSIVTYLYQHHKIN